MQTRSVLFYSYVLLLADTIHILKDNKDYRGNLRTILYRVKYHIYIKMFSFPIMFSKVLFIKGRLKSGLCGKESNIIYIQYIQSVNVFLFLYCLQILSIMFIVRNFLQDVYCVRK